MELSARERELVDIYSIVSPDLFIVDGLKGSNGFQPQEGDCLLAASDAVALDAVLSTISGIRIEGVESLCLAAQYGLGQGEPGAISLLGDDLGQFIPKSGG